MNKSANYAMRYEKLSNALQNIPGEQTLQHFYLLFYREKLSLFSLIIFSTIYCILNAAFTLIGKFWVIFPLDRMVSQMISGKTRFSMPLKFANNCLKITTAVNLNSI